MEMKKYEEFRMMQIDFETPNLDLAEEVLQIANECNPNHVKFKVDIKVDMTPLMRNFIKAAYPDIEESMIDAYVQEYRKKEEAKKEAEEKYKKEKKDKIRERIKGQAQIGWDLAYRLCGDSSDDRAKRIRYETYNSVPDLSVSAKIEICEQYLPLIEKDTNLLAKEIVFWRLAELKAQKAESQKDDEATIDEISYCLEKYYDSSTDKIKATEKIIRFCRAHKVTKGIERWEKTYVLLVGDKQFEPESSQDLIYKLISLEIYDTAELELDRMAEYEKQRNEVSCNLAWIESIKYRMKYYRRGYTFLSKWNPVDFYDYCNANDKDIEKKLISLKLKYQQDFYLHRQCLTDIELYCISLRKKESSLRPIYIAACEQEMELIPRIISFIDDARQIIFSIPESEGMNNIHRILKEDKYKLANCIIFKELALYYTKTALYDEAIRVCDKAIACGYLNDGTKMGMIGRKNKIIKKKADET